MCFWQIYLRLLTDLSKALSDDLLLEKLHAYGFSFSTLKLIHSYLKNKKQRTNRFNIYFLGRNTFRVPQGSILEPFLFNVFPCETDFASYADEGTPYVAGDSIEDVINLLENDSIELFKWFADNQMKRNKDKWHLLISRSKNITLNIDGNVIGKSICGKLLGVSVDYKLKFNEHLDSILKRAGRKVNALSRILPYMNFGKRSILMNSFFTSQFNYRPLVWMFHSRTMNNKINHLHERCLRIVCSDKTSSFEKSLETDRSVPIHIRNLQILVTEFFKESKDLSPTNFNEIFSKRNVQYNLCHASEFSVPNVKSTFHGT